MKVRISKLCIFVFLVATLTIAIFGLIRLMRGNVSSKIVETSSNVNSETLSCTSDAVVYPFFTYDNSSHKELKIKVIFNDGILRTIALHYLLFYNDANLAAVSEAQNHAAMNINFYKDGLKTDEFSAKYTRFDNQMRMNLYANGSNIDKTTIKYFFVDDWEKEMPKTIENYRELYTREGLKCEKMSYDKSKGDL